MIEKRNLKGPVDSTPYKWLTAAQAEDVLHRKIALINRLRLAGTNTAQALLSRVRELTAYKQFVVAVAEGSVARAHAVVSISLRAGDGIHTILEKFNCAARDVYRPLAYEQQDYQRLFLFHKLGGVAVAELAHRAFGLPSIKATHRHIVTHPIIASPGKPNLREMARNLDKTFPHVTKDTPLRILGGFQMMADEIKLETRMRWDPRTNNILGVCRDCNTHPTVFAGMEQANAIYDALQNKEVHLATEVCYLVFVAYSITDSIVGYCSSGQFVFIRAKIIQSPPFCCIGHLQT